MDTKTDIKDVAILDRTITSIEDDEKSHIKRDYSGAIVSVDLEEQRLVRKLDWRIMVSPLSRYDLC